jgi:DNA-binding transcriptional LysR family regulator
MRSDSAEALKAAVKSRLGIAMLMAWNANQELRNGSLKLIRTDTPRLLSRMVLLQLRTSYTPRITEAFIQMARTMSWTDYMVRGISPVDRRRYR